MRRDRGKRTEAPLSLKEIADVERVEIVFKDGVGYDPQKLADSVRGLVGIR